jgi:Kef-type K+ transport system membrane component KefB
VDDTLGILGLAFFTAFALSTSSAEDTNIWLILLRMGLFFIVASAFGIWLLPKLARWIDKLPISQGLVAFAFIIMLIYAWSAEILGNLAAILGAFLAGLFFARSPQKEKIERGFAAFAYAIFVPIFFVNVGLSADLRETPLDGLLLLAGMFVVVVISKLLGAILGGRFGGFSTRESIQLGFSMLPRGEVVLILAAVGIAEGLIEGRVFSMIVMLVVLTTLITPPILQYLFSNQVPIDDDPDANCRS